ncbi:putative toxin-antitoxin system toxin component, PIN family [Nitrososphaera sp.]|uniref:putative toxin-antitoxin system toxin component, PIN family n=1 Tax=Nitrososphaera sp. TaxID=1971748 RepID=UPI0031814AB9
MKIVLDTNVLISALIKEGKPRNLLFEILRNHELVISREILEEVVIIANEPKIQKYVEQENIADFLRDKNSHCRRDVARVREQFYLSRLFASEHRFISTVRAASV